MYHSFEVRRIDPRYRTFLSNSSFTFLYCIFAGEQSHARAADRHVSIFRLVFFVHVHVNACTLLLTTQTQNYVIRQQSPVRWQIFFPSFCHLLLFSNCFYYTVSLACCTAQSFHIISLSLSLSVLIRTIDKDNSIKDHDLINTTHQF